jgi:predicted AlkP superfamily pyrophosphatase or phosphodiesterase
MFRAKLLALLTTLLIAVTAFGSAYQGSPRLVVILVIDQFRGDYLDRYHDEFGPVGFRNFTDRGAYFPACYYNYANTRTAPGHATLATGAYSVGHGIFSNDWYDPARKAVVSSVDDDKTKLIGAEGPGASPHNLMADTIGDELRLATQGNSRVFGVALKDRAAILPAGYSANAAYWIDHESGAWVTSTYYMETAPHWVTSFNEQGHAKKYLNLDWKDNNGQLMGSTNPREGTDGKPENYYELVGATPYANDYEFDFARELIQQEKLGQGTATDLLVISLSANDVLGHQVGPDSPQMHAMVLALDHQIGDFFQFLSHQFGLAQVWVTLSADHGIAPITEVATRLHIPAAVTSNSELRKELNKALGAKLGKSGDYVRSASYPIVFLDHEAFSAKLSEADAEIYVAAAMKSAGMRNVFTKQQLAEGEVPPTVTGRIYANSYSPYGGWWVMGEPPPFTLARKSGTDHGTPYSYDQHVPLAFFGVPFRPGVYREQVEPIDMVPTLSVLLGINKPTSATGRVLTEALLPAGTTANPPAARPRP